MRPFRTYVVHNYPQGFMYDVEGEAWAVYGLLESLSEFALASSHSLRKRERSIAQEMARARQLSLEAICGTSGGGEGP